MTNYDYRVFIDNMIPIISTISGGRPLIEQSSAGDIPAYPFCTYQITSPYLPITSDLVAKEQFELVVSFTWHGKSSLDMLNLAMRTNKYFRSGEASEILSKKNVTVSKVSNYGARDNFISIDYERSAGLDVRFRVSDNYVDEYAGSIGNITYENKN